MLACGDGCGDGAVMVAGHEMSKAMDALRPWMFAAPCFDAVLAPLAALI